MDARAGILHRHVNLAESVDFFFARSARVVKLCHISSNRNSSGPEASNSLITSAAPLGISSQQRDVTTTSPRALTRTDQFTD